MPRGRAGFQPVGPGILPGPLGLLCHDYTFNGNFPEPSEAVPKCDIAAHLMCAKRAKNSAMHSVLGGDRNTELSQTKHLDDILARWRVPCT